MEEGVFASPGGRGGQSDISCGNCSGESLIRTLGDLLDLAAHLGQTLLDEHLAVDQMRVLHALAPGGEEQVLEQKLVDLDVVEGAHVADLLEEDVPGLRIGHAGELGRPEGRINVAVNARPYPPRR